MAAAGSRGSDVECRILYLYGASRDTRRGHGYPRAINPRGPPAPRRPPDPAPARQGNRQLQARQRALSVPVTTSAARPHGGGGRRRRPPATEGVGDVRVVLGREPRIVVEGAQGARTPRAPRATCRRRGSSRSAGRRPWPSLRAGGTSRRARRPRAGGSTPAARAPVRAPDRPSACGSASSGRGWPAGRAGSARSAPRRTGNRRGSGGRSWLACRCRCLAFVVSSRPGVGGVRNPQSEKESRRALHDADDPGRDG